MSPIWHALKRFRRCVMGVGALIVICAALVLVPTSPASAAPAAAGTRVNSAEARLLRLVNATRGRNGLPGLRLAPGYTDVARRWSRAMAARRTLVHNPSLAAHVRASGGAHWLALGENVAYGDRPDEVFHAYMASAPHRANILASTYRYVGIGWVESAGGQGYTTLVFSSTYSAAYGASRVAAAPCCAP